MTDATFFAILDYVRANSIPPLGTMLPDGMGIGIRQGNAVAVDNPQYARTFIRLNPADHAELKERLADHRRGAPPFHPELLPDDAPA